MSVLWIFRGIICNNMNSHGIICKILICKNVKNFVNIIEYFKIKYFKLTT